MADTSAAATATGAVPAESPAQKQARLRRERRAAKLQDGENRLQAITALQGGTHRDVKKDLPAKPSPSASPKPGLSGTATPDPAEIDISEHHYTPAAQARLPSPFAFDDGASPQFGAGQGPPGQDDMMAMLQQMMGGGGPGGMPGAPGQSGDLPPGLANLMSAMGGGGAAPEPSPEQSSAWLWRLVHALFSFGLAVYIVLRTPFTGSKLSREFHGDNDDWASDTSAAETFAHFFYLFATFEVVLQTSRYYIERGRLQGSGILSTIGGLLPEPYAGYVRVIGRYSVIYSTVVSDAMVVVFVLGAASWWKGGAAA
ncbi:hypothetical protein DPSP01_010310 [Paraphaeosphaeria sporulosa]|uniref:GET complex, subunit GET2 n=1 Tax=Paraphaeosphaeria sporulosa TaxID=1460663 RepID=A0A177CDI1_9PLEO|nr:uncharacterized protein CC84DRAFT_1177359 [Paraphaeosphaeria sporulosa]OAG05291.1 hypothetical protein CC84DRAFT_1177359 [Paraphaeosphaeria sporulosa]